MRIYKTVRIPSVSFASAGAGGVVVGHKPAGAVADRRRTRPERAGASRPAVTHGRPAKVQQDRTA